MCHPVFSTKEFVQEFIFYSGVQELPEFRSCRMDLLNFSRQDAATPL
jgi:hypothetical protein